VLSPDSLREIYQVMRQIRSMPVSGKTFSDICAKVPIADIFQTKKRKKRQATNISEDYEFDFWSGDYDEYGGYDEVREIQIEVERIDFDKYSEQVKKEEDNEDILDKIPDNIYCDLVETLNEKCVESSLLEIWRYDERLINTTTTSEILAAVNNLVRSPWFGYTADYPAMLGGVERNSSGHIVSARSMRVVMVIKVPQEGRIVAAEGGGVELQVADHTSLAWEEKLVDIALRSSTDTIKIRVNAARSFGDVSTEAIFFDASLMAGGYIIMFLYTVLMLGKMNRVEVRLYLTISGIVSIMMGLVIAIGLSSVLGYPYTPIHAILPFLCLGIGIDDMFVISQCWQNIRRDPTNHGLSIPDKMGIALKHAGVSVTVTSATDVFAFGVGAVTQMPGLQSFCVCTAIGLGSIYLLQVSWFIAWMSLDESRIAGGGDGVLPCIVHQQNQDDGCPKKEDVSWVVKKYSSLLSSLVFKIAVISSTLGMLCVGVWGSLNIRQEFDPTLLLPADSYLRDFLSYHDKLFPDNGWTAYIYTQKFDHTDLYKLEDLTNKLTELQTSKTHIGDVDCWWTELKKYSEEKTNFTNWQEFAQEDKFPIIFSDFLFSSYGSNFKPNFKFDGELICNQPAPPVVASKFKIDYLIFTGPEEHIPAKRKIEELVKASNLSGAFSHVQVYAAWETDEIIGFELWRNIGLAMLCVFVVTLILLANIPICLMVLIIVIITLANIIGFLHFWDITIDIISCINLVLAIGLCVDYSVHIGHAFLIAQGSRKDRAVAAIATIGPAVFNGGVTTLLALVLLGASTSHVFVTFFKVFVLTVLFGLFHGLVFFPVILSTIGPASHSVADNECQSVGSISTNISPTESENSSPTNSSESSPTNSSNSSPTNYKNRRPTNSGKSAPNNSSNGSHNNSQNSSPYNSQIIGPNNSQNCSPTSSEYSGPTNSIIPEGSK